MDREAIGRQVERILGSASFAGKNQLQWLLRFLFDSEIQSDHAQFRQYSSALGRWMRPDPYYGSYDFGNPQTFNRYAYALNNPLSAIDRTGLVLCDWGPSDNGGEDYDDEDDCGVGDNGGTPVAVSQSITVDGGEDSDPSTVPDGNSLLYGAGTSKVTQNVGCFLKGAAVGAVGAVAVGALAVGAVTIGAPVAAVTGVLGAVAVVGGVALGIDVSQQVSAGNWAGVAYDAGSVVGGAAGGYFTGGAVANGIKPGASSGWSFARDVANRYIPSLGSVGQWLGTGPDAGSAGGAVGSAGAGGALVAKKGC